MEYIENNKKKSNKLNSEFIYQIAKLHSKSHNDYGFDFDTQIGGMKQPNKFESNWVEFFCEKRLNLIFEHISKTDPMPNNINKKLEILLKNLNNELPSNPKPSLLHGDLWEGNILYNNDKLVGFIDPGSFYGHNEMEIAYLRWFKLVGRAFIEMYSNYSPVDKMYFKYEPIYQIYYSLMNVHLWNRDYYIQDVESLLNKLKI